MSPKGESVDKTTDGQPELRHQFPALNEMLRALNSARKQFGMYGSDHPNALSAIAKFTECMDALVDEVGSATCIFTKSSIIVNDHQYIATDTHDLYQRLRVRGVLGVTMLSGQSPEQALAFLGFLNAEPSAVKRQGGPNRYLRKHGVSRIVVTEQVYRVEGDDSQAEHAMPGSANVDRDVGRVLQWLLKQEEQPDDEAMPVLPIGEILADPDATAKLIREAVTKLHRSRRPKPQMNTLTHEVVSGLQGLTGLNHEAWDKATPQVRKAISKLPQEMRPRGEGFTATPQSEEEKKLGQTWRSADVAQVEAMVAAAMEQSPSEELVIGVDGPRLENLEDYFSARPTGIMSAWQDELRSAATTASSASTLSTLLAWEQSPAEHARIASALAALVKRSVESNDLNSAARCAKELANEAVQEDRLSWRAVNARMILQRLDAPVLVAVASYALDSRSSWTSSLATALVEAAPAVGLAMADLLGVSGDEQFTDALKGALAQSDSAGVACLGKLLRLGRPLQAQMALDVLAGMHSSSALAEITSAVKCANDGLVISALKVMPKMALPDVAEAITALLSHRAVEVRCAALHALGRMGDPSVLPRLFRIARFRLLLSPSATEQIAAIQAIGMIPDRQSHDFLERMAKRTPLIGRAKAESLRAAADSALDGMPEFGSGETAVAA